MLTQRMFRQLSLGFNYLFISLVWSEFTSEINIYVDIVIFLFIIFIIKRHIQVLHLQCTGKAILKLVVQML